MSAVAAQPGLAPGTASTTVTGTTPPQQAGVSAITPNTSSPQRIRRATTRTAIAAITDEQSAGTTGTTRAT